MNTIGEGILHPYISKNEKKKYLWVGESNWTESWSVMELEFPADWRETRKLRDCCCRWCCHLFFVENWNRMRKLTMAGGRWDQRAALTVSKRKRNDTESLRTREMYKGSGAALLTEFYLGRKRCVFEIRIKKGGKKRTTKRCVLD